MDIFSIGNDNTGGEHVSICDHLCTQNGSQYDLNWSQRGAMLGPQGGHPAKIRVSYI